MPRAARVLFAFVLIVGLVTCAPPTTEAPTTATPTTEAPVTAAPVTQAPSTAAPVTAAPVTAAPVTAAPVTAAPVTAAPVTAAPVTAAPVTAAPNTGTPTANPTTGTPTANPTTEAPSTGVPSTGAPSPAPTYGSGYSNVVQYADTACCGTIQRVTSTITPSCAPTALVCTAQPKMTPAPTASLAPTGSPITSLPTNAPVPTFNPTAAPTFSPVTGTPSVNPTAAPTGTPTTLTPATAAPVTGAPISFAPTSFPTTMSPTVCANPVGPPTTVAYYTETVNTCNSPYIPAGFYSYQTCTGSIPSGVYVSAKPGSCVLVNQFGTSWTTGCNGANAQVTVCPNGCGSSGCTSYTVNQALATCQTITGLGSYQFTFPTGFSCSASSDAEPTSRVGALAVVFTVLSAVIVAVFSA